MTSNDDKLIERAREFALAMSSTDWEREWQSTKMINDMITAIEAAEGRRDSRRNLCIGIAEALRNRGHWVPDNCLSPDILIAVSRALEAAESRALAADAKHGKTADSLRIERQGFNSRMNAIEKAHRILGAAIQDGIYPEMVGEREIFCSVDLKANEPTRPSAGEFELEVYKALRGEGASAETADRISAESRRRLFPQEQEPKT